MTDTQSSESTSKKSMGWKKTLLFSFMILFVAAVVTFIIFRTEPTAQIGGATKETAMLVDVISVNRGSYIPTITSTGTVIPAKDILLSPRVSGEIIYVSDNFTPGGFVEKGETLLQIDPSDYKNVLQLRESELLQAEADLNIEMGRQNVALKDYQLLEDEFNLEDKSLVLREPQMNAAKSRVEAARAAVSQAKLDLQRTAIQAPFNAHILNRSVNIGSQVSVGQELGRLVGLDVYWVELTVPLSRLKWLSFPDSENKKGASVKIRNRTARHDEEWREGNLHKMIGALEGQTRLARILVEIEDPLAQKTGSEDNSPLVIGSFVEAGVQANEIKDVFRLSRDHVRTNETVWVMVDNKLEIRNVGVLFQDADYAYIDEGLNNDEKVVTTNLSTVTNGVSLRVEETVNTDSVPSEDVAETKVQL